MTALRMLPAVVLGCVLSAVVTACGGSTSSTTAAPTTAAPATSVASSTSAAPPSSAAPSAGGTAAKKVIAANWTTFFNAKTPVAKRVSLLQNGSQFASIISSQAGGGLAAQATAKVTKVTLVSSTLASVTYSILLNGQSVLPNQAGVAVAQDGTWKVSVTSFCGLLKVESGGKTSSLPVACKAAG
jgi:hypothetical protein